MPPQGLTPRQHRLIRTQLVLIPGYVWLVHLWVLFWHQLPGASHRDAHVLRDFLHFYTQGLIARLHDSHALYDMEAMAAVARTALPEAATQMYPPVYGPQVALLFLPFAHVSYLSGLYVWLALTVAVTCWCVFATWRSYSEPRLSPWVVFVLLLGFPGLHFTLSFGQASIVGLLALTWLWLALRGGRMVLAGLAVGVLAYKPQLGIVLAAVFVGRGEWRVVTGAVLSIVAQGTAAAVYWGPSIFLGYANALSRLPRAFSAMEPDAALAYSIRAVLTGFGLSSATAVALSAAISLAAIVVAVRAWQPTVAIERRYSGIVFVTLLIDPHLYAYDMLLAAPAMLLAAMSAWSEGRPLALWTLGALWTAPIVAATLSVPPAVMPALLALNAWLTLTLNRRTMV
ncbi:MAG: glycosyltransferase family 87 protein [Vicinamibacterales bacterium]